MGSPLFITGWRCLFSVREVSLMTISQDPGCGDLSSMGVRTERTLREGSGIIVPT